MIPTIDIMPDGSVRSINPLKLTERPFWLVTDRPDNYITIPSQAQSAPYLLSTNLDGPIDITGLAIESSGACLVWIAVSSPSLRDRYLSQSPIHSQTAFGTGGQPYPLPEVLRVTQLQKLKVWITNLTTENNTVKICVHGRQLQKNIVSDKDAKLQRQGNITFPYFLVLDDGKAVLASGQMIETPLTLGSNLDYQLFQISGVSTGSYTLNLLDADTGESVISAPADKSYGIANNLIVGSAIYPFRFHVPRLLKRGQRMLARITDTSMSDNEIYLTFGGRCIFQG